MFMWLLLTSIPTGLGTPGREPGNTKSSVREKAIQPTLPACLTSPLLMLLQLFLGPPECSSVHLPHWHRGRGRQSQGCQSLLNPQHPTKGRERQGSEGRQPVFPRKQMMGSACPVHHIPIHHTLPRLTAPSDARSLSPEHPGRHSALEGDPTPPSVSG